MAIYKAQIIGFKKSEKSIGKYYPIFEYEDRYEQSRIYVGRKAIEKTPFAMDKTYFIHRKNNETFERSERPLSPKLCLLSLRIVFMAIVVVRPELALLTIIANTLCNGGYFAIGALDQYLLNLSKERLDPIPGKIIGFKKVTKKNIIGMKRKVYCPSIEYKYNGEIYIHIGSVEYKEKPCEVNTSCLIYVDEERRRVADEFEVEVAPIPIPDVSTGEIKNTCKEILKETKNRLVENTSEKKSKEKYEDVPHAIPLREGYYKGYKRASGL